MRIYRVVAEMIVPNDMRQAHGFRHAGSLKKFSGVGPHVRIIDDTPAIAFEMQMIHRIEADQSCKQPPIRFGDLIADEISGF